MFRNFLVTALCAAGVVFLSARGAFQRLDREALDLLFRFRGPEAVHSDILPVSSLNAGPEIQRPYAGWPFVLLREAATAEAGPVLFDPAADGGTLVDSAVWWAASAAYNLFLPLHFRLSSNPDLLPMADETEQLLSRFALPRPASLKYRSGRLEPVLLNRPSQELLAIAKGAGAVAVILEKDGKTRRAPAVIQYRGRFYLNQVLAAAADYFGLGLGDIVFVPGVKLVFPGAGRKRPGHDLVIPLDEHNNLLINWMQKANKLEMLVGRTDSGTTTEPVFYLGRDRVSRQTLKGKVLVCRSSPERGARRFETPLGRADFTDIQISILSAVLSENSIAILRFPVRVGLTAALCLMVFALLHVVPQGFRTLAFSGLLGLTVLGACRGFLDYETWINPVEPVAAAIFIFAFITAIRKISRRKIKNKIRDVFRFSVDGKTMDRLVAKPENERPVPERKNVSLVYVHVSGLDSLTSLPPSEFIRQINNMVSHVKDTIFQYGGAVDKFSGEGVLCYFGAPLFPENHALRAVQAALVLQQSWRHIRQNKKASCPGIFKLTSGVHSGEIVMGGLSLKEQRGFILAGESIGFATRLSGKAGEGSVLISETTYKKVSRHVEVVRRGAVLMHDKPVKIYEVMNFMEHFDKERRKYLRLFTSLPIQYKPMGATGNFKEKLVDISGGGFMMTGEHFLMEGQELLVNISLPNGTAIHDAVVTIVKSCKNESGEWESHSRFSQIREEDKDEIVKFVYGSLRQKNEVPDHGGVSKSE